jgi:hypothetical protein
MPTGQPLPMTMFQFTKEEIEYCRKIGRPEIIDNLIPQWYAYQEKGLVNYA